jgi:hypothetical protein
VKVYGAVPREPEKVIFGDAASLHTAVVPFIDPDGKGFIVTTALPDWVWEHAVLLAS